MSKFCKIKLGSLLSRRGQTHFCLFVPSSKVLQEARAPAKTRSVTDVLTVRRRPLKHVCHMNVKAQWANSCLSVSPSSTLRFTDLVPVLYQEGRYQGDPVTLGVGGFGRVELVGVLPYLTIWSIYYISLEEEDKRWLAAQKLLQGIYALMLSSFSFIVFFPVIMTGKV